MAKEKNAAASDATTEETKTEKRNAPFTLKKGMQLWTPSIKEHLTPENCTDALAVETLAENPGRIVCFATKPDNWKELVADFKAKKEKEAK